MDVLRVDGVSFPVGRTPARLLTYLASNCDRVVATDELLREVWSGARVTQSSVQQAVHVLREALGAAGCGAALIRTVRGRGYQLETPVEVIENAATPRALPPVGRSGPLGRLIGALEDARAGRGQLVLVAGPPGAGKTRLVWELETLAPRRGFTLRWSGCPEGGAAALWPWEEILRGLQDVDPAAIESLSQPDRATLGSAFPSLGCGPKEPAALEGAAARHRLYEAVRRVLAAGARIRPLVLAIDDLEHADAASVRLLEWIAGRIPREKIVLIATHGDPDTLDPLFCSALASLQHLPHAALLTLAADAGGAEPGEQAPIFPTAHVASRRPPFVGRTAELADLDSAWRCAREGAFRLVLLSGEAGIGKSRLAAERAALCAAEGGHVLAGRCREALSAPYQPFLDALAAFVAACPARGIEQRLGRSPAELTRLLPELADALPSSRSPLRSDPEIERYALHRALASWLAALAGERPTLLLLDDLHWAREPEVAMLEHLALAEPPGGLLVLAAHRPLGEESALAQRIGALRRVGGLLEIAIGGLSGREVAQLAAAESPPAETAALHARTAGNPFFVLEALRAGSGTLPRAIQSVVSERVSALGADSLAVLRAAAVLGERFDRERAWQVAGLDAVRGARALDRAAHERLIEPDPERSQHDVFVHDIVREAVLSSIPSRERTLLHRRALELPGASGPRSRQEALAERARHAAAAGDIVRSVTSHHELGDAGLHSFAFREAVESYTTALRGLGWPAALEKSATACDLLIKLATAQGLSESAAHWETARRACHLALELQDPARCAKAAFSVARPNLKGMGQVRIARNARAEALAFAAARLGERDALGVRVRAALLGELGPGDATLAEGAARARELEQRAAEIGDPRLTAEVSSYAFYWYPELEGRSERLALTERLARAANADGDPALRWLATTLRVRALFACGEVEEADCLIDGCVSLADQTGRANDRSVARHLAANRLRMRGRFAEAAATLAEAHRIGKEGGIEDTDLTRAFAEFCVTFERGRMGLQADALRVFAQAAPEMHVLSAMSAAALAASGRRSEARAVLDGLLARDFGREELSESYLATTTAAAVAALLARHHEAAETLVEEFLPRRDAYAFTAYSFSGLLGHHAGALLGLLGRLEEADVELEAAIECYRRDDAPLWEARACLDHARVLRDLGRPDARIRIRRLGRRAASLARSVGVEAVPLRAEPRDVV